MTSSENLPNIEPWSFRAAFADSWLSEAYARDTETLTRALQKSLFNNNNNDVNNRLPKTPASDLIASFMSPETPTASNVSSSEPETLPNPKRHRTAVTAGPNTGKITKRKPRVSKKTQTTFITADPENFRQMVQQVTGIRFGNAQVQVQMAPVLKPEPHRPGGGRFQGISGGCLPTLDTSAYFLDHHQQQQQEEVGSASGSGHFDFQADLVGDGLRSGLDFDVLSNIPTLESWKVM